MARIRETQFAATIGHSSSTYTADSDSFEDTLETALSEHDVVFIRSTGAGSVYNFSDTYAIPSGKTIIGQPGVRPILRMAAATNKTVITNADAATGGLTTDVTIKNVIIDQQGALQTAGGGGIVVTGIQRWTLHEVKFMQSYRFNFLCLHQSTGVANNTGTVTFTKDSATATGINTLFSTELAVGDILKSAGGQFGRVLSITNNTSLTLTLPWGSATETGVTYKTIEPNSDCVFTNIVYGGTVDDADASGYGFFDDGIVSGSLAMGADTGGCGFVPDHARNMQLINLVAHTNDNSGISLETCEDCTITNPVVYGNVNGNGVQFISGTSRCTVQGGTAHNHTNNGYVVSYNTTSAGVPRDNIFDGCVGYLNGGYAFRNDGGLNTEYDVLGYNNDAGGLIVNTSNGSVSDAFNIHDSHFFDDRGGSKSQDRGVFIAAGTNGFITNTTALDSLHVIAGIVDSGTNTTKSGNTTS